MKKIGVTIVGGTGYGAGETLRLLAFHPEVTVCQVISKSSVGSELSSSHPHLYGFYQDLKFTEELDLSLLKNFEHCFIITALPHHAAGEFISLHFDQIKNNNTKIIDLSGAYRLTDLDLHKKYYPEVDRGKETIVYEFCYGLTECFTSDITKKSFISNPGCLATACILSVAPIANLIDPIAIAFDTKTGSSGSGRELKQTTHHPTRHADYVAYKALSHQHEPEVMQALNKIGLNSETEISFVAQSLPIARGIYVTTHIINKTPIDHSVLQSAFSEYTKRSPFIRFYKSPPNLQPIVGTNYCDLAFAVRGKTILVMTAIDNLVKGMAGQGIQNMNLIAGLPQETGLLIPGMRPY